MNVVVIGIDDEFCVSLSKTIATHMQIKHINFDESFETSLLASFDFPIEEANLNMLNLEKKAIEEVSKFQDTVISISHSTFISNANYNLLSNSLTVCVEKFEANKILNNIQKLIKKHCKIAINQEKINKEEIKNQILNYFSKSK